MHNLRVTPTDVDRQIGIIACWHDSRVPGLIHKIIAMDTIAKDQVHQQQYSIESSAMVSATMTRHPVSW
jgi:hypothetical protein